MAEIEQRLLKNQHEISRSRRQMIQNCILPICAIFSVLCAFFYAFERFAQ